MASQLTLLEITCRRARPRARRLGATPRRPTCPTCRCSTATSRQTSGGCGRAAPGARVRGRRAGTLQLLLHPALTSQAPPLHPVPPRPAGSALRPRSSSGCLAAARAAAQRRCSTRPSAALTLAASRVRRRVQEAGGVSASPMQLPSIWAARACLAAEHAPARGTLVSHPPRLPQCGRRRRRTAAWPPGGSWQSSPLRGRLRQWPCRGY